MAFSINQVRHLYVATAVETDNNKPLVSIGDIIPRVDKNKSILYFNYMGAGGLMSSDVIDIPNIMSAKATSSESQVYNIKKHLIALNPSVSNTPIPGQEYILRIAFRQYIGLSEEDQYFKYASVVATKGMTESDLLKELAYSLVKNLKKELNPLVGVYVFNGTTSTLVTPTTTKAELKAMTVVGLILTEQEQSWTLGKMPVGVIPFTPQFVPITVDGEEAIWGTVVPSTKDDLKLSIKNGKVIADMEYFHVGARGDIYRGMGYPNNITTHYTVDPSKEYDTLDIHYYFVGSNGEVQKSEKDITIVAENDGTHTLINKLITEINTKAGLKIAPLA